MAGGRPLPETSSGGMIRDCGPTTPKPIPGPPGPPGPKGDKGDSYVLTPEDKREITEMIWAKLTENADLFRGEPGPPGTPAPPLPDPLFTLQYMDAEGTVHDEVPVPLGGTVQVPPQVLRIWDEGESYDATAPVGKPIQIEVTGTLNASQKE